MPPYCTGAVFLYFYLQKNGKSAHRTLPVHLQNIWYPHSRHTTAMEITIKFSVISIPNTIPTPIKNSINPVSFPISVSLLSFTYYSICLKINLSTVSCFYSSVSSSEAPPAPGTNRFTKSGTISKTLVRPS